MSSLTPRGAPADEREILLSVTSRRPLELVHNNCSKAVRDERHEWQDSMAEWAVDSPPARHVGCTSNCADQGECDCSHAYGGPRQPRRPEPRTPHLPMWTRFKLWVSANQFEFVVFFGFGGFMLVAGGGALLSAFLR